MSGDVEIVAQDDTLVIQSAKQARAGWAAAFQQMAERGDDALLGETARSQKSWDEDRWE